MALIVLTIVAVYLPTIRGGPLVDDNLNITKPALQSADGLYRIWFDPSANPEAQYYPFAHTVFWIEHRLWGDHYVGYHLMNIVWHSLSVILLYRIVTKLNIPGALLAAAIFAVHPVMVESVAWISEQKNTLSTVFYLSAMLAYLRFDESRQGSRYLLALVLFALALLTKTATVTLPAALLVIFWWQRGTLSWRRDVLPLAPFFALGIGTGLITISVEQTYFRAQWADVELTPAQRILLAGRAIWFYLGKLLWPDVMYMYPRWTLDSRQWWQWSFPIAALATTITFWAIRKRWRAPLAGWLLFCGTLFPGLGFVSFFMFTYTFVADHIQYLASLAVIVPIATGLARLAQPARRLGIGLCVLLFVSLAVCSLGQSRTYIDIVSLFQQTLEQNPDAWFAHDHVGVALYDRDRPQEAMDHYRAAIRLMPKFPDSHNNLGTALIGAGRLPEAIEELQTALTLKPNEPVFLTNMGLALINSNRLAEAVDAFHAALEREPDDPVARSSLGVALTRLGRTAEAIECLQDAAQLHPENAQVHENLGAALLASGNSPAAFDQFQIALTLDPNHSGAHNNLGAVLARKGELAEAIVHFEQAARLSPGREDIQRNLANALHQAGRPELAVEHYQVVLRLRPDDMTTHASLVKALAAADRSKEAISTAKKVIEAARSARQDAVAESMEEWLEHYRTELRRSGNADSNPELNLSNP